MRLKKFLRSQGQAGQITTEYFVLLCVIATITIITSSRFFTGVGGMTNSFIRESTAAMDQQDLSAYPAEPVVTTSPFRPPSGGSGDFYEYDPGSDETDSREAQST